MRASDWLETGEPQQRIRDYNARVAKEKQVGGIPGMLQFLDQILRRADLDGTNTWPSAPRIYDRTFISPRATTNHWRNLVAAGLIEKDPRPSSPKYFELSADHRPPAWRVLYGPEFRAKTNAYLAHHRRLRTTRGEPG